MFLVRTVRVEDAKLAPVHYTTDAAYGESSEGLLMKAESPPRGLHQGAARTMIDWASVHANLDLKNMVGPGQELMMALMSRPRSNSAGTFKGACNAVAMQGRVSLPQDASHGDIKIRPVFYSFDILGSSMGEGPDGDMEITFAGEEEAARFVSTLIHQWFNRLDSPVSAESEE